MTWVKIQVGSRSVSRLVLSAMTPESCKSWVRIVGFWDVESTCFHQSWLMEWDLWRNHWLPIFKYCFTREKRLQTLYIWRMLTIFWVGRWRTTFLSKQTICKTNLWNIRQFWVGYNTLEKRLGGLGLDDAPRRGTCKTLLALQTKGRVDRCRYNENIQPFVFLLIRKTHPQKMMVCWNCMRLSWLEI